MGRSGGAGGFSGGGHSGGGFGGGHNTGGFSGGGRSSGGFGGGNFGGNFGGNHQSGNHHGGNYGYPPPIFFGGGYHRRRGYHIGCGITVISLIFVILAILLLISEFSFSESSKPINTTERTALVGQVQKTDWYEDDIGWISSRNVLIAGLEDFYKQTGIQPFVLFVRYDEKYWNGDGSINPTAADEYLEQVYSEKFNDEAHFIFAYFQCEYDSKQEMDGEFRYLSGYAADTIMDSEAIDILWGYSQNNYYNQSLTIEKMIADTFSQTAEKIMSKPTNAFDVVKVFFIIVGVIVVAVIVYLTVKNINKRKKEKAEETAKILNTPLSTFGDDTSDLEDKYND